jgi:hypothetical protein
MKKKIILAGLLVISSMSSATPTKNDPVYLVVTMGSNYGISNRGFGGVSVTYTPDLDTCRQLKEITLEQIERTANLDLDGNEVIVKCKKIISE